MNPLRAAKASPLPSHVAATIVHLPDEKIPYHANRREVVRVCLDSQMKHHGMPDVHQVIWSNGSSKAVNKWLVDRYPEATIILSPNIGKSNARYSIFSMLPDEIMISLSDDDMFFYPGWMKAMDDIYQVFPKVGQVTGYPVRTAFRWACTGTIQWAMKFGRATSGRFVKDEYDKDFCTSIGRDYEWHKNYTKDDIDWMVEYRGMKVLAHGHHCQFYGNVGRIRPCLQRSPDAMVDEKPFDWAVNNANLLRLATIERYARHIGNVMDDGITAEVIRYGLHN
jgi:hypothetical protein